MSEVRTPVEKLIYEAVKFAYWAAGQGICPVDEEGASAPDEFLMRYSDETGDEDWETLAFRLSREPTTTHSKEPDHGN
tara:strand:- start:336 stop:569 length:234 start_codon:yes stop_codon:yes gene_type:complete